MDHTGKVKELKNTALIDTGASVSVMAESLAQKLNLTQATPEVRVRGVDSRPIQNKGEVWLDVDTKRLSKRKMNKTQCICITHLPYELVLGLPAIDQIIPEMRELEKSFKLEQPPEIQQMSVISTEVKPKQLEDIKVK